MVVVRTHPARYHVLAMELAGQRPTPIGVLLEDPAGDRLYVRLRRDWRHIAPEESDVLVELEGDILARAHEMGAARLLAHFEDLLSNLLRIGARQETVVEDYERALDRLYRQHVHSTVQPFVTHLPRYSLQVAAGKFLENQEVTAEGWEETPNDLRPAPEMFVARVVGRSMEPLIPDGSVCVFRFGVVGSREGRLVLVENRGEAGGDRYTVKRYHSERVQLDDGSWAHTRIRLVSLNPEYPSWDLEPDEEKYRIIAEFVRVLS